MISFITGTYTVMFFFYPVQIEFRRHIRLLSCSDVTFMYIVLFSCTVPKAAQISEKYLGVYMGACPLAGKFPKAV
jgi:hypothetical protein